MAWAGKKLDPNSAKKPASLPYYFLFLSSLSLSLSLSIVLASKRRYHQLVRY